MTCSIMSVSVPLILCDYHTDGADQETLDDFLDFVFEVLAAAVSECLDSAERR